jgi:hypothetical protein
LVICIESWSPASVENERVQENAHSRLCIPETRLLNALQSDGLPAKFAGRIALYNPPWTPPFMRRNEVMVEVD